MSEDTAKPDPAAEARTLAAKAERGSLATRLARSDQPGTAPGHPYVSLVLVAWDEALRPLFLLSELADHTRNLRAEPKAALLLDGTAGFAEPLAGPRVTLLGGMATVMEPALLERYLERHPGARAYAGFRDFHLWRMEVEAAHLVAGFGRISWIEGRNFSPG